MDLHLNPKTDDNDILVATASADKTIQLYTLEIITPKTGGQQTLNLVLSQEIQTTDEVMFVKFSPDG